MSRVHGDTQTRHVVQVEQRDDNESLTFTTRVTLVAVAAISITASLFLLDGGFQALGFIFGGVCLINALANSKALLDVTLFVFDGRTGSSTSQTPPPPPRDHTVVTARVRRDEQSRAQVGTDRSSSVVVHTPPPPAAPHASPRAPARSLPPPPHRAASRTQNLRSSAPSLTQQGLIGRGRITNRTFPAAPGRVPGVLPERVTRGELPGSGWIPWDEEGADRLGTLHDYTSGSLGGRARVGDLGSSREQIVTAWDASSPLAGHLVEPREIGRARVGADENSDSTRDHIVSAWDASSPLARHLVASLETERAPVGVAETEAHVSHSTRRRRDHDGRARVGTDTE